MNKLPLEKKSLQCKNEKKTETEDDSSKMSLVKDLIHILGSGTKSQERRKEHVICFYFQYNPITGDLSVRRPYMCV